MPSEEAPRLRILVPFVAKPFDADRESISPASSPSTGFLSPSAQRPFNRSIQASTPFSLASRRSIPSASPTDERPYDPRQSTSGFLTVPPSNGLNPPEHSSSASTFQSVVVLGAASHLDGPRPPSAHTSTSNSIPVLPRQRNTLRGEAFRKNSANHASTTAPAPASAVNRDPRPDSPSSRASIPCQQTCPTCERVIGTRGGCYCGPAPPLSQQ